MMNKYNEISSPESYDKWVFDHVFPKASYRREFSGGGYQFVHLNDTKIRILGFLPTLRAIRSHGIGTFTR
jgi:hypothetical protein